MSELSDLARAPSRLGTVWGFAIVLLGILCLMTPFLSGIAVNTLVAIMITAAGLSMTVFAFKAGSFGKGLLQFLFGGISVLGGVFMLVQPVVGLYTMTAVLIAWFIVDGAFAIVAGIQAKGVPARGWIIVSGIASLVLAILLWRQWPASGAFSIGLLVGVRLIFAGWSVAMLGMMGDATIDEAEDTLERVAEEVDSGASGGAKSEAT